MAQNCLQLFDVNKLLFHHLFLAANRFIICFNVFSDRWNFAKSFAECTWTVSTVYSVGVFLLHHAYSLHAPSTV